MDTEKYLELINAPGVGHHGIEWQTDVKPAAKHAARKLRKVTRALVVTGVEFSGLSVNNDRETGELPWGTWSHYPYVITHKGRDYARLYTVDGSIQSTYLVDGDAVDWATFASYLTPSQANAKRPLGGTITVKMENLRVIGDNPRMVA